MDIEEFYGKIGGDYLEVLNRFVSKSLRKKILPHFLTDPTYEELKAAIGEKDAEKAFLASHTLKGLASNLGFTNLFQAASDLTEELRGRVFEEEKLLLLFSKVTKQYEIVESALKELD